MYFVVVLVAYQLLVGRGVGQELLQNGGYESLMEHWECWNPLRCSISLRKHSGAYAMQVENRWNSWEGPYQFVNVSRAHTYHVSGYIRLLNDEGNGQTVRLEIDFEYLNDTHRFSVPAGHSGARASDGWIYLSGSFTVPKEEPVTTRLSFTGPDPRVDFLVDDASLVVVQDNLTNVDPEISRVRKSDINIRVTTPSNVNKSSVKIRIVQRSKLFPFGTAVAAWAYNNPSMGAYRDFIHQHFNWAAPDSALTWAVVEPQRGKKNYEPAINVINGLRTHGIKVRGQSLVWSVEEFVQDWVKRLHGDEAAASRPRPLGGGHEHNTLEHWDVNNENLHGQWFQNQLHDPSYNLELFRIAHVIDPHVKLFLNDYDVVASGASTRDYLQQALEFKMSNVSLYGLGVQCHFAEEEEPSIFVIKERLDILAQAGLPIWITALDVQAEDENRRANFYEKALTALYSHPAVEGILLSGFWDKAHQRGGVAALAVGDNLKLTAAGKRVLDLYENRWMTDVTHALSAAGSQFTIRGFHGDYDLYVYYEDRELVNLRQTFLAGDVALLRQCRRGDVSSSVRGH
ncbi:hypothetical protein C0Q70_14046 [Pomacea canaliculata]|uniref:GH10 domain-containing protein n=1 Tax=Pomacea canaliculata TaxID=400727 RepID=A0A2T7NYY1_POMCA|nr:hypothetical protein C0Q70_14046 [Pomacea canaliculata]